MKIEWNKKYTTIAVYSLIVICISIVFYLITSQVNTFGNKVSTYSKTFSPFVIGAVLAYLFNFIMRFVEEKILLGKKLKPKFENNKKLKRSIGIIVTYIVVMILLYIFYNFIFPQIIESIKGIINNIPHYITETSKVIEDVNSKLSLDQEYSDLIVSKWDDVINKSIGFVTNLLPKLAGFVKNFISSIWNLVIGLIVSIYILLEKEKFAALAKKILAAAFSEKRYDRTVELSKRADRIFSNFLGGKIVDSLIIGVMTFIILKVVHMPFAVLVSFIVGVTNIIPFFGPFIGAVPSFIIILFESPVMALWFLLIILIIQQIDGNIIGPKILGDSLGISAFWILFSLLITGKLLGLVGLIVGVPLFTFVYSIIKDIVEAKLEKKGLPIETKDYE